MRDLMTWETLAGSTFMMRPYQILKADQYFDEAVLQNLRSACAFSYLVTPDNSSADEFYANMIKIPQYRENKFLRLMDKENATEIVREY